MKNDRDAYRLPKNIFGTLSRRDLAARGLGRRRRGNSELRARGTGICRGIRQPGDGQAQHLHERSPQPRAAR